MKSVFDFLKILSDATPFPNFVSEKMFNTKAYLKKIKSIDGRLLAHLEFLGVNLEDRETSENHKKQKNNI
jgi:hypothetical protein